MALCRSMERSELFRASTLEDREKGLGFKSWVIGLGFRVLGLGFWDWVTLGRCELVDTNEGKEREALYCRSSKTNPHKCKIADAHASEWTKKRQRRREEGGGGHISSSTSSVMVDISTSCFDCMHPCIAKGERS